MNKFVRIGNYLLRAENIDRIYDAGEIRRVFLKPIEDRHFIDTSQTLDELLEVLNSNDQCGGEQNE